MSTYEPLDPDLIAEVSRVADRVAREWAAVTDSDDLYQDMMMRILENDYVSALAGMEPGARWSTLKRIGVQVASQSRTDHDQFTGNYFYSTREVRAVLAAGALSDDRSKPNTERMDVDQGLKALRIRHARYVNVIEAEFRFRERVENRMDVTRAVDALTEEMNRVRRNRTADYTEGPGTRQVLTNAQATAHSERQY